MTNGKMIIGARLLEHATTLMKKTRLGFHAVGLNASILAAQMPVRMRAKLQCEKGQGTTEYAILVGVLVVIAILAIMLFKDKLAELWEAISTGINGL